MHLLSIYRLLIKENTASITQSSRTCNWIKILQKNSSSPILTRTQRLGAGDGDGGVQGSLVVVGLSSAHREGQAPLLQLSRVVVHVGRIEHH